MDFNKYYFNEENLTEINWLKSRFFSNAFRALAGSGKRKVNPQDFKKFTELTPAGFSEMFTSLSNRYEKTGGTKVSGLKHFIKNAFTALFNPQKAQELFPYKDKEGNQKYVEFTKDPKTQVKSASYYETNKGGRLMLVYLEDDNEADRYYIGLDGNALKFFVAPIKQGGLGKDFRTWLAAQAASTYKPDQKTMSPEFLGKGEKGEKNINKLTKIQIDQNDYNKLAPKKESINPYRRSNYLLDLFENEVLEEKTTNVYLDPRDSHWKSASKTGNEMDYSDLGFNSKDQYIAVPGKGDTQKDITLQAELDSYIKDVNEIKEIDKKQAVALEKGEWFFVNKLNKIMKNKQVSDDDFKKGNLIAVAGNRMEKSDQSQKDLETTIEKIKKKNNETSSSATEKKPFTEPGQLYNDIKDEIKGEPAEVKATGDAEEGWRYLLKNSGVLFLYKSKTNGKYYLSYNEPAKKKAEEIIQMYNIETAPEAPTAEGYTIWDYLNKLI